MDTIGFSFDNLSPTGSIGIILIISGIIFSGLMGMVLYNVINDSDSLKDRERKQAAKDEQKRKISRLYPSQKD